MKCALIHVTLTFQSYSVTKYSMRNVYEIINPVTMDIMDDSPTENNETLHCGRESMGHKRVLLVLIYLLLD